METTEKTTHHQSRETKWPCKHAVESENWSPSSAEADVLHLPMPKQINRDTTNFPRILRFSDPLHSLLSQLVIRAATRANPWTRASRKVPDNIRQSLNVCPGLDYCSHLKVVANDCISRFCDRCGSPPENGTKKVVSGAHKESTTNPPTSSTARTKQ